MAKRTFSTGGYDLVERTSGMQHSIRLAPRLYNWLTLLLAAGYGAVLSQIPAEHFKDFSNYIAYAEHSWLRLLWLLDRSPLETLANEPVWLLINAALGAFLSPEGVVRTIIVTSSTLVAVISLRSKPEQFYWLLLLLMLPIVLKNHLIHLRQGLAVAVFMLGWFSSRQTARLALMALTPFIHASFFFVLLVLWVARGMMRFRFGPDVRALVLLVIGLSMGVALEWLAAMLGARQASEYAFKMAEVSGLGFVFWFSVLALMAMEGRRFLREYTFETGLVIFYLATYWLIEVTARIFESGLLLVLLAGLALTGWRRPAFLSMVLVYGGLMWLIRIGQPAMGFGIG